MKIENQVCSLDLAKRLKELGVKQESLFYWVQWEQHTTEWVIEASQDLKGKTPTTVVWDAFPAFTVAELGEILPKSFQIYSYPTLVNGKETWDCTSNDPRIHSTEGWEVGHSGTPPMFSATEADARAKMLVYLLENKLITL